MTARWQGTIALLLLIIISYVDRVNISVMILNPEFAEHFQLNENRMLQGMLMTCFLLGYAFSALLLTPVIESKLHYRQGLLSSIAIWAAVCAISPLLGSLMGMLIARVILGVAEGPLFSLKTRFISDNFSAEEIGKPNAVTALGVSLGLAVGFPLVTADGASGLGRVVLRAGGDESGVGRRAHLAFSASAAQPGEDEKTGVYSHLHAGTANAAAGLDPAG